MTWRRKKVLFILNTRFFSQHFSVQGIQFFLLKATFAILSTIRDFSHWLDVVPFFLLIKIIYVCASVHHRYSKCFSN